MQEILAPQRSQKHPGGRPPGTPNRVQAQVKQMILDALEGVGGANYLMAVAVTNPQAFCVLVAKVLPLQIKGDPENPIHVVHEVRRTIVYPKK